MAARRAASDSALTATAATSVRRQPVMERSPPRPGARCAEVAGGTAAECAAVICCCPCGLLNLLVLTLVRLPAGLCRRAVVKRRRKKRAAAIAAARARSTSDGTSMKRRFGSDDDEVSSCAPSSISSEVDLLVGVRTPAPELAEIDKEMWARFYGTGFWRSPSQRDDRLTS